MPFITSNINETLDQDTISLLEYNKNVLEGATGNINDISLEEDVLQIRSPTDFRILTINYMNSEANNYGYPDIFAAMSLKNSSIPELAAEGASWTEFFDSGMTFIDYEIKSGGYTAFTQDVYSVKENSLSPKVNFTPSLTFA